MNILTNRIEYSVGDASHQAYLAYDDENGEARPGIVIVHEWWGLNDYIVKRAHMLAELGYVALAIDMYGDGQTAENPDEAGALMTGVLDNMDDGTAALKAGYELLLDQPGVDGARTAAIGYCFGGAMALHMARIGVPAKSVAIEMFEQYDARRRLAIQRHRRQRHRGGIEQFVVARLLQPLPELQNRIIVQVLLADALRFVIAAHVAEVRLLRH